MAPLLSMAVTETKLTPAANPVMVSVLPDTVTVAVSVLPDTAVIVWLSSVSLSLICTVTVAVVPADTVRCSGKPTITGVLFGTGTVTTKVTAADVALVAPLLSIAVTLIVLLPRLRQ